MKHKYSFLIAAFCLLVSNSVSAMMVESKLDVNGLLTEPGTFYLSDDDSNLEGYYYKTSFNLGDFVLNHYWGDWGTGGEFGGGFTYSNGTDKTTPGFNNLSAYPGIGVEADSYLISNTNDFTPAEITLKGGLMADVKGAYFTNSTYAALAMRDGYNQARKFGGDSGEEPDWFLLTITGYDAYGKVTGTVDFYLADYRFEDSNEDYIVEDWQWVDLTPLGYVNKIGFSMTSSDNGDWGMNTPSYFCMDGLSIFYNVSGIDNPSLSQSNAFYADGQLYIQGLEGTTADLYSTDGKLIQTISIDNDTYSTSLSVASGIYFLRTNGNPSSQFKIVVNK